MDDSQYQQLPNNALLSQVEPLGSSEFFNAE